MTRLKKGGSLPEIKIRVMNPMFIRGSEGDSRYPCWGVPIPILRQIHFLHACHPRGSAEPGRTGGLRDKSGGMDFSLEMFGAYPSSIQ